MLERLEAYVIGILVLACLGMMVWLKIDMAELHAAKADVEVMKQNMVTLTGAITEQNTKIDGWKRDSDARVAASQAALAAARPVIAARDKQVVVFQQAEATQGDCHATADEVRASLGSLK